MYETSNNDKSHCLTRMDGVSLWHDSGMVSCLFQITTNFNTSDKLLNIRAMANKANKAQKFLLDNNCGDLILNDHRTTKPEDRIYASDIMMMFLESERGQNIDTSERQLTIPDISISCDTTEFIKYCKEARNKFVQEFWQNCGGDVNARVMAEDLLIAYDQLVQRVSSHEC
jgi:hypothetical protein